jgi:hypothetical protein
LQGSVDVGLRTQGSRPGLSCTAPPALAEPDALILSASSSHLLRGRSMTKWRLMNETSTLHLLGVQSIVVAPCQFRSSWGSQFWDYNPETTDAISVGIRTNDG